MDYAWLLIISPVRCVKVGGSTQAVADIFLFYVSKKVHRNLYDTSLGSNILLCSSMKDVLVVV